MSLGTFPDEDIVGHLADLGDRATVKADRQQYEQQGFMRRAIRELTTHGVHVSTVSKNVPNNRGHIIPAILHDKLILVEYENRPPMVIIGSAGFTRNVQDNLNFENMVAITDEITYRFLLRHFTSIAPIRTGITVRDIV